MQYILYKKSLRDEKLDTLKLKLDRDMELLNMLKK